MKKPQVPQNEEARLEALHGLKILDTLPEERFDRLTRLARRLFNVPIALVSLVDENRQWFKSCQGLQVSETSRDVSFCGHTILGDQMFLIPDTEKDKRFVDNPLVTGDPEIRFYAGCPLRHIDGSMLGTLCIIDREPRDFNKEDLTVLTDLAELAERELMAVQLATLDELTGLSNRRGFITLAQKALSLCSRQEKPASVLFLDLNRFKAINDTYGHAEGDQALIDFATLIKSTFRDSDVFGRLGGDEFAVLLTDSGMDRSQESVHRFREIVNRFNRQQDRGYDLSFSDGIVSVQPGQDQRLDELLRKADQLMYSRKSAFFTKPDIAAQRELIAAY